MKVERRLLYKNIMNFCLKQDYLEKFKMLEANNMLAYQIKNLWNMLLDMYKANPASVALDVTEEEYQEILKYSPLTKKKESETQLAVVPSSNSIFLSTIAFG